MSSLLGEPINTVYDFDDFINYWPPTVLVMGWFEATLVARITPSILHPGVPKITGSRYTI